MRLHLYQRGKIWWVRGSEGGVKVRETTHHTSKRKARLVRDRLETEYANPAHFRANKTTVAAAKERWLRGARVTYGPETYRFYEVHASHIERLLGPVTLARLSYDRILTDLIEVRIGEGAASQTVHGLATTLRLILKDAKRRGDFHGDPRDIVPKVKAGYVPQESWVEPEVIWAAIAHLPQHRGAALAWCAATACDFSNIPTARRTDVLEDRVRVRGTKTSARDRWLPRVAVFETFMVHAMAYANAGEQLFDAWPNMPRDVRRACRAAKVEEFTARTIRRSCATWMARARVDFGVARKFMGHASFATLLRVYAKYGVDVMGDELKEKMT